MATSGVIHSGMDLLEVLGIAQRWLLVPLVVVISLHTLRRLYKNVKDTARLFEQRVREAYERERERLIEDVKADLLKTLNKGSLPLDLGGTVAESKETKIPTQKSNQPPSFEYSRRLDRKDKTNIVNEIIYQIQSGDSNRNCTDDDKVENRIESEDSAILKDVHRRNVVARMKNIFEANDTNKWQLNHVVDLIKQNKRASPLVTTSLENLRSKPFSISKAASEPPVVRLRRKIRSQQSLSESSTREFSDIASSIEDILDAERFSKRLSQYSISEYLDEDDPTSPVKQEIPPSPDYNRVARGIKTLSTFSLSELLRDDEPDSNYAGVTLRRSNVTLELRKPVENIDQILIDENLSRCYSQYSISDLVDDEVVFVQDYPAQH